ncbi:MAG: TRAP transporter permease [Deltaproteobacteria bacterium]|nr:TRAP transporter permease [Deltaproteobacteria bacterium]
MAANVKMLGKIAAGIAIVMSSYHLYTGAFGAPEAFLHRSIHLMFTMVLIFLLYPFSKGKTGYLSRVGDFVFLGISLTAIFYIFANYEYFITRYPYVHPLSTADLVIGILFTLTLLEAARRSIGSAMPITAVCFIIYAYIGPSLPGLMRHAGFNTEAIIDQLYMTTEGIFGIPLGVSATYVILFVIFGVFLEKSGTGQFFMELAAATTGKAAGGPGKIAVVSSALFGTISGSAVANVMVTGQFTIPMMKRTGFQPHFAGAVEATASTGGQIMPPVMGAAAFVMAEFMGVPYLTICKHAIIPAVLYYLAVFMAVHFEAVRTNLRGMLEAAPHLGSVLLNRGHLLLPVAVMLYILFEGYTPMYACIFSIIAVLIIANLRKATRMGLWKILDALENGAKGTLSVACACACAGIIIGVVNLTGLGLKFTGFVLYLAGDSLIPALLFTMVAGIILGMGLPTTAAYIVMAALLVPGLVKLGIVPIAAHMFAFYYAIISAITPPVALAVYAGAGLAGSNIWKTGLAAVRIGAPGFIIPFMFAYEPSLLFVGSAWEILSSFITAAIGVIMLAGGLIGWFVWKTPALDRLLLVAGAVLLIKPGIYTDIVGLILLAVVIARERTQKRKDLARTNTP